MSIKNAVQEGDHFIVFSLDLAHRVERGLHPIGPGLYVLNDNFNLGTLWVEQLGTLVAGEINGSIKILAVGDSSEKESLRRTCFGVLWGLLAKGWLRFGGRPGYDIVGLNTGSDVQVKSIGTIDPFRLAEGILGDKAQLEDFSYAARISENYVKLFDKESMWRVRRATWAFLEAFWRDEPPARLHQFVRAVEGVLYTWGGRQFSKRVRRLLVSGQNCLVKEMYRERNYDEHMRRPLEDSGHDFISPEGMKQFSSIAIQAEALARYCLSKVLADADLWPYFEGNSEPKFWKLPAKQRDDVWGSKLDLDDAIKEFDPQMLDLS